METGGGGGDAKRRRYLTPQEAEAAARSIDTRIELESRIVYMDTGLRLSKLKLAAHLPQNPLLRSTVARDPETGCRGAEAGAGDVEIDLDDLDD